MVKNEGDPLKRVIVCTPKEEYARAGNRKEHNIGDLGDPAIAIRQHDALKETLRAFGADVLDVPELAGHPNSVFTRDTAICTPQGYIKLHLGLATRQREGAWMAQVLNEQGERCIGEIKPPGTVEGGDVILAGDVAFIGRSVRTNDEGIRQFSKIMKPMGYEIRVVNLPETILHLDKVLMVLGEKQLLYCNELVSPDAIRGFDGIEISCSENTTANIICLGNKQVLVNRSNELVIDLLRDRGYIVHDLDLSEFAKGMGGPNCLIMPVERSAYIEP
jgi:dimethylargininase